MANEEKRSRERIYINGAVLVVNTMNDVELGKLVNLHEDGFLLITSQDIEEGAVFQLKFISLPPIDGVEEINVGAECLWVSDTGTGEQLWAGFHIMDVSEAGVSAIRDLTERFPLGD